MGINIQGDETKDVYFIYADIYWFLLQKIKLHSSGISVTTRFVDELECCRKYTRYTSRHTFGRYLVYFCVQGIYFGDKIYQTSDGGLTWAPIPNTSEIANFLNLFFVSPQVGYAEGSSQLATTIDGGNSWTVKTLPGKNGLTIFFVDPSVGFYGDASGGGLNKTSDAGKSWTTVYLDTGISQSYYPFFLDEDTGYVATGSGTFSATSNGGQTWQTRAGILPVNQYPQAYNQLYFQMRSMDFMPVHKES